MKSDLIVFSKNLDKTAQQCTSFSCGDWWEREVQISIPNDYVSYFSCIMDSLCHFFWRVLLCFLKLLDWFLGWIPGIIVWIPAPNEYIPLNSVYLHLPFKRAIFSTKFLQTPLLIQVLQNRVIFLVFRCQKFLTKNCTKISLVEQIHLYCWDYRAVD